MVTEEKPALTASCKVAFTNAIRAVIPPALMYIDYSVEQTEVTTPVLLGHNTVTTNDERTPSVRITALP